MKECKCCGNLTLSSYDEYETCDVCEWIDDPEQNENPMLQDGANDLCLEEYKELCRDGGIEIET